MVPGVLILLPATTGGITKSLSMYGAMAGASLPDFLPGVFALMITATIAGVGKVRVGPAGSCRAAGDFWACAGVMTSRGGQRKAATTLPPMLLSIALIVCCLSVGMLFVLSVGLLQVAETSVTQEEVEVVRNALDNAGAHAMHAAHDGGAADWLAAGWAGLWLGLGWG